MDRTIHEGRRWSAANAYLRPALARPQPDRAHADAMVTRILFEGRRAVGVAYRAADRPGRSGRRGRAAR